MTTNIRRLTEIVRIMIYFGLRSVQTGRTSPEQRVQNEIHMPFLIAKLASVQLVGPAKCVSTVIPILDLESVCPLVR